MQQEQGDIPHEGYLIVNESLCLLGHRRTSDAHHCLKLCGLTTGLGRFEISFARLAAERYVEARRLYASNCHYAF